MILHAQVEYPVFPRFARRLRAHHHNRRRLPTANVPALTLGRFECRQQPLRQIPLRLAIRLRHRRPDRVLLHQVRLHAELTGLVRYVAGRGNAARPRVTRHAPLRIDHRHLPQFAPVVAGQQPAQRIGRASSRPHRRQPQRAIRRVGHRLRRDRPDSRFRPRHDRPDAEPVRLHGHADLPRAGVARHDGVRMHRPREFRRRSALGRRSLHGREQRQCNRRWPDHRVSPLRQFRVAAPVVPPCV